MLNFNLLRNYAKLKIQDYKYIFAIIKFNFEEIYSSYIKRTVFLKYLKI